MRRDSQGRHNGWFTLAGDTGRFGADYAGRAVTANLGLAANTAAQAVYRTPTPTATAACSTGATTTC